MAAIHQRVQGPRARRGRLRRAGLRAHRAAPRRARALRGAVPVPRRAHAVVRDRPVAEGLLLLRLPGLGRRVHVRAGDRGRRLQRRAGAAGRPLRGRARARAGGPSARPSGAAQRERLLELLARTSRLLRALPVGVRGGGGARASTWRARGLGEEILREFRVGYAPERVGPGADAPRGAAGSPSRSCTRRGWRSARKQNGRPYDRFRARIMFPLADMRGRVLGFGARAMREDEASKEAEVPEHLRQRRLPQGSAPVRRRSGARARGARGAGDPVRGLHRRDRAAPGGHAQRGRSDGHRADRRAGGRAGADGPDGAAGAGRRQRRAGGDAARGRPGRASASSSCAWCALPAGTDPAELCSARGPRR